ncbi:MAG TPA: hypothetical protein VNV42_03405 [Solirubrobacteraceae bacterium]|jgi:hypothetical protein|nr:hypothetical protein [Solirubrobacteraceae bacterium]
MGKQRHAMLRDRAKRLTGVRRRALVAVVMALVVSLGALASASPAVAEPKGIFKIFRECPTATPGVAQCIFDQLSSGEFSIGAVRVPIDKALTLQLGDIPVDGSEVEFFGVPAKNGESLSKTELSLPISILGTVVTATPELVISAKNQLIINESKLVNEDGAGLTVPMRLHLVNPVLGDSCYIGSESNPLLLRLTTGATHPPQGFESLQGAIGTPETLEEKNQYVLRITGNSLVDNTFPAPGAEGCGDTSSGKGSLDGAIDEKLKIPDKAGENAVVLGGELNLVGPVEVVVDSESWPVAPSLAPPVPGGLPASDVTQSVATLNGTLKTGEAPVDYHFEYGTTTSYGQIAPIPALYTPITSETLPVSQPVGGLQAGTTYHYRLVAGNPTGIRVVGPDETFTTLPIPIPPVQAGGTSNSGGTSGGQEMTFTTGEHPAPPTQRPVVRHTLPVPHRKAKGPSSKHARKRGGKHKKRKARHRHKH